MRPTTKEYRQIRFGCPPSTVETLSGWLSRATGQPVVEERIRSRRVLSVFMDDIDETKLLLLREGARSLGGEILSEERLTDRDWEELWKRQGFKRFRVNGWLNIVPDWDDEPVPGGPVLRIHPHLAFGTGHHETTGRCLSLLVDHMPVPPVSHRAVLDFGSGTGILGIAALATGHGDRLFSVDDDPLAREATLANIDRNGYSGRSKVLSDMDDLFRVMKAEKIVFPLIVANVTGSVITRFLPEWWGVLPEGGKMILSGISTGELDSVTAICPEPFSVHRGRKFHTLYLRKIGRTR